MFPAILAQIGRQIEILLNSENTANAVTAVLLWREVTLPVNFDPNDESSVAGGTVENKEREFRAFFHQVDHRLSGFQRNLEVQTGDVILDYQADLDLTKEDLRVKVGTQIYTQKLVGKALKEAWDVMSGTGGTLKTLLLTPAG